MYFFNLKALIQDLREGKIGEAQVFKYLCAHVCLYSLNSGLHSPASSPQVQQLPPGLMFFFSHLLFSLLGLAIAMLILNGFYRRNGADQGRDFVIRLMLFWWIVGNRVYLIILPFLFFMNAYPPTTTQFAYVLLGMWVLVVGGTLIYTISTINEAFRVVSSDAPSLN